MLHPGPVSALGAGRATLDARLTSRPPKQDSADFGFPDCQPASHIVLLTYQID